MKARYVLTALLGTALLFGSAMMTPGTSLAASADPGTPPGLEKQGKMPPGQAQKNDADYQHGRMGKDGKRHNNDRDQKHDGKRDTQRRQHTNPDTHRQQQRSN